MNACEIAEKIAFSFMSLRRSVRELRPLKVSVQVNERYTNLTSILHSSAQSTEGAFGETLKRRSIFIAH